MYGFIANYQPLWSIHEHCETESLNVKHDSPVFSIVDHYLFFPTMNNEMILMIDNDSLLFLSLLTQSLWIV